MPPAASAGAVGNDPIAFRASQTFVAESAHATAAPAADRCILKGAGPLIAEPTGFSALAVRDDPVTGILRLTGIAERSDIAAPRRADRRIFHAAETRFVEPP